MKAQPITISLVAAILAMTPSLAMVLIQFILTLL